MKVTMPTKEEHARLKSFGFTRYSFAEVEGVIRQIIQIEEDYEKLVLQAYSIIEPHNQMHDIGFAPESIQALNTLLEQIHRSIPAFGLGVGKERYPLTKWNLRLATWRSAIRKITQAINVCQAQKERG